MKEREGNSMQICSKAVYDLLTAFNNLPSIEEQEEVLDVIYDAMYKRSYKTVLAERVVIESDREMEELEKENARLRGINEHLQDRVIKCNAEIHSESKKRLHEAKKGLLTIISNIKHFAGSSWNGLLPGGMEEVDRYLEGVDTEHIMGSRAWVELERKYAETATPEEEIFVF